MIAGWVVGLAISFFVFILAYLSLFLISGLITKTNLEKGSSGIGTWFAKSLVMYLISLGLSYYFVTNILVSAGIDWLQSINIFVWTFQAIIVYLFIVLLILSVIIQTVIFSKFGLEKVQAIKQGFILAVITNPLFWLFVIGFIWSLINLLNVVHSSIVGIILVGLVGLFLIGALIKNISDLENKNRDRILFYLSIILVIVVIIGIIFAGIIPMAADSMGYC